MNKLMNRAPLFMSTRQLLRWGMALLLLMTAMWAAPAQAQSYSLPSDIIAQNPPFNGCTGSGSSYSCPAIAFSSSVTPQITFTSPMTLTINGNLTFTNSTQIIFDAAVTLNVTGNLIAQNTLNVTGNGYASTVNATNITFDNTYQNTATVNLSATTTVSFGNTATVVGSISTGSSGNIVFTNSSTVTGAVSAGSGGINTQNTANITGNVTSTGPLLAANTVTITGSVQASTVTFQNTGTVNGSISASGNVTLENTTDVTGNITAGGAVSMPNGSTVSGNVTGSTVTAPSGSITGCDTQTQPGTTTCNAPALTVVELVEGGAQSAGVLLPVTVYGCTTSADCHSTTANQYTQSNFGVSLPVITGGTWCAENACATVLTPTSTAPTIVNNGTVVYFKESSAGTVNIGGANPNGGATNTSFYCYDTANAAFNTAAACNVAISGAAGPDHVEFVNSGSGLTCTPAAIKVYACTTSADCSGTPANQYTTGNFSVAATPTTGAKWCVDSVCATALASPASISNGTTIYVQDTSAGSITIGGTSSSAVNNTTIQCSNTGNSTYNATTACSVAFAASGFLVSLSPTNSVAGATTTTLTVEAVKSGSSNPAVCVPMFGGTRNETLTMSYVNPTTGTKFPTVNGTAMTAASGTVSLPFNASTGIATVPFVYPDVGQIKLTVSDSGLSLSTATPPTPIFAPASFTVTGISPTGMKITAGSGTYSATVTAMNGAATPAATPNFGKETTPETVTLTATPTSPATIAGTIAPSVLSAFTSGADAATNLTYSEVGYMDITATLTSGLLSGPGYLSSGLSATGNSGTAGAVGRFIPDHFVLTGGTIINRDEFGSGAGCSPASGFTYMSEPMSVSFILTAKNGAATPATTLNYAGTLSKFNAFSAAQWIGSGVGNVNLQMTGVTGVATPPAARVAAVSGTTPNGTVSGTSFASGSGTFTANVMLNRGTSADGPYMTSAGGAGLSISATPTDNDAVTTYTSANGGSYSNVIGTTSELYGRMNIANAYGSLLLPMPVAVQAQYWNGSVYLLNANDSCTLLGSGTTANFTSPVSWTGISGWAGGNPPVAGSNNLSYGMGSLTLSTPSNGSTTKESLILNTSTSTPSGAPLNGYLPGFGGNLIFGVYRSGPVIYAREVMY